MRRSRLLVVRLMLLITFTASVNLFAQSYSGGDGSESTPFQISNKADLKYLSENSTHWFGIFFKQTQDIIFTESDFQVGGDFYNGGAGFTPIGNGGFGGTFVSSYDGQDYIIDGIYINRPTSDYQGFFGYLGYEGYICTIENLGIVNVTITGQGSTGALAGYMNNVTSLNCYATGDVTGSGYFVGGLVGFTTNTAILYSHFSGDVTSTSSGTGGLVGGVAGSNNGIVQNYTTGSVTGTTNTGGLVGYLSSRTVMQCYSTASVVGSQANGGLVGYNYFGSIQNSYSMGDVLCPETSTNNGGLIGTGSGDVSYCYSTGSVSGNAGSTGGLIGAYFGDVTYSYWDTETSGQTTSSGGTGKTTAEMHTPSTYVGFAFWLYWSYGAVNDQYPFLQWQEFEYGVQPNGTGTSQDPYQIASLDNLLWVSTKSSCWDKYFIQTTNIDASATSGWNDNGTDETVFEGFSPIGNSTTNFTGNYDGQGYTISNLLLSRSTQYGVGFFGYTNGAEISNMGIEDGDITGSEYVGGLVGESSTGTISNCYNTGSVLGSSMYIGGIAGSSKGSTISSCYNTGSVIGSWWGTGGLIGSIENSSTINNCYNTGSVSAQGEVGGITGYIATSTIQKCYSTGSIIGIGYGEEGLVGYNDSGTVSNSFWDTETSGQTTSQGGTGKTTIEMQTESTYTSVGWDFTSVWGIDGSNNGGYPYLGWQDYTDFPGGQGTDVGGGTTVNPSDDLNLAEDQTIPEIPNEGFTTGYEVVLAGSGIIDITLVTGYQFGAYYFGGSWNSQENSGGEIVFEDINFDSRGDIPIILGDDNPLPVTLSSFTAVFSEGSSLLSWTTQSESNNLGWNVYRSETEEVEDYMQINEDMIEGAGTTIEQTDYTFADQNEVTPNSSYWYWIESLDYGGTTTLHGPVRIDIPDGDDDELPPELLTAYGLSQNYPNPFNPTTKIAYKLTEANVGNSKLIIYNTKGQVVKVFEDLTTNSSDIGYITWNGDDMNRNKVSSGIYLYKLMTSNKEYNKKMIMMK